MNKVITKTALGTFAALVLAALIAFSLWILISPQTMASLCEKTGNYSFAVTCADLRYKYTDDVEDLARCAQDGILARKDKFIVKYCEKLVSDSAFESLCEKKDNGITGSDYAVYTSGYKNYIFGNLSAAQYRTGNTDKAIETAKSGNTFTKLIIEIIENGTVQDAEKVLAEYDGSDENLKRLLQEFINEGD